MTDETANTDSTKSNKGQIPLRGLVAAILNEREVAINLGQRDGAKTGMRFAIVEEFESEIEDPDTGEILGKVPPREKIRVEIFESQEKMSIAKTYHNRQVNIGGKNALGGLSGIFGERGEPVRYINKPFTFHVGEGGKTHFKEILPEDSVVDVGDLVIQIVEEPEGEAEDE
jgi:hypothetical protein